MISSIIYTFPSGGQVSQLCRQVQFWCNLPVGQVLKNPNVTPCMMARASDFLRQVWALVAHELEKSWATDENGGPSVNYLSLGQIKKLGPSTLVYQSRWVKKAKLGAIGTGPPTIRRSGWLIIFVFICLQMLKMYSKSAADLDKVLQLEPKNAAARKEMPTVRKLAQEAVGIYTHL